MKTLTLVMLVSTIQANQARLLNFLMPGLGPGAMGGGGAPAGFGGFGASLGATFPGLPVPPSLNLEQLNKVLSLLFFSLCSPLFLSLCSPAER